MSIGKFEDLDVWQEGMRLSAQLYKELKSSRDYGLRDQIQRAAISIASNIAEGFERRSNKEFIQHLYIAKGSCGELRTHLYLCKDFGTIPESSVLEFLETTRRISAMLYKLIKTRSEKV